MTWHGSNVFFRLFLGAGLASFGYAFGSMRMLYLNSYNEV
jgi:hypothetical protein